MTRFSSCSPFRHLLKVDTVAREPEPERLAPLGEELGFEQLAEHRRAQQRLPCEDCFDGRHVLLTRVDDERCSEERAELRQNVFEE